MKESDFLRSQAEACRALSRSSFDLAVAGRLRAMADTLCDRAAEVEDKSWNFVRHSLQRNGAPSDTRDRD